MFGRCRTGGPIPFLLSWVNLALESKYGQWIDYTFNDDDDDVGRENSAMVKQFFFLFEGL